MVMKKKLEAELISIAHRILKMKNKSDLVGLHQETQRLYEKLSVLRFVDEHFSDARPTIGHAEVEQHLSVIFDSEQTVAPAQSEDDKSEPGTHTTDPGANKEATSRHTATQEVTASQEVPATEPQSIEQPEPVAALDSPEEQVAGAEIQAVAEAQQENDSPDDPEQNPEPEPTPVEEPAEQEKPKEIASDNSQETFKPAFELAFDAKSEDDMHAQTEAPKITPAQISFDDLLGQDYVDPVFVKPEEVETATRNDSADKDADARAAALAESNRKLAELRDSSKNVIQPRELKPEIKSDVIPISRNFVDTANVISINKETLNDRISKGITIGLNDRIAFMKHLFNNSSEDYNRVLSQLITIDTWAEAKDFIDNMVKPDYNNWEGKDEYEQRFMEIIEKKFA